MDRLNWTADLARWGAGDGATLLLAELATAAPDAIHALYAYHTFPKPRIACPTLRRYLLVTAQPETVLRLRHARRLPAPLRLGVVPAAHLPLLLSTFPVVAHLMGQGQVWSPGGAPAVWPTASPDQLRAALGRRLLTASAVVPHEDDSRLQGRATRALAELDCAYGLATDRPPAERLAAVYQTIPLGPPPARRLDAPACLPDLQAIYAELDTAVLVVGDPTQPVADWSAVQAQFAPTWQRFLLTSSALLPLIARHELVMLFTPGRFRLVWGTEHLSAPPLPVLLQHALRTVLETAVWRLTSGYLTHPDEQLNLFFHDMQNLLLRIQLQHDVLSLFHYLPDRPTPTLPAQRGLPPDQRFASLWNCLNEWVDHYRQLLDDYGQPDA